MAVARVVTAAAADGCPDKKTEGRNNELKLPPAPPQPDKPPAKARRRVAVVILRGSECCYDSRADDGRESALDE